MISTPSTPGPGQTACCTDVFCRELEQVPELTELTAPSRAPSCLSVHPLTILNPAFVRSASNTTSEPIIVILFSAPSNVPNSKSNNRCIASRVKQHAVFQTDLLCKYWKMSSIANIIIFQFFF